MADVSTEERAVVLADWSQPACVGEPQVFADEHSVSILFRTREDRFAVIRFPLCSYVVFGAPNDEALGGHPLAKCGLSFYSVHEIHNSSLLHLLERRNSVHQLHDRAAFLKGKKHYVITFQDSTFECVVRVGECGKPTITLFNSLEEAERCWRSTGGG